MSKKARSCSSALQAPVAGDLRAIVSALQIAADLDRMGALALHVAKIARRRHPYVRVCPRRSTGTSPKWVNWQSIWVTAPKEVAAVRRTRRRPPRIDDEDDAMDDLHKHTFTVLMDREWKHGVAAAVDVTLLGRFYERFADHAVEVARRVIFQATGKRPDDGLRAST